MTYACCKGCLKRHPACSANCKDKAEADAKYKARKDARMKQTLMDVYTLDRKKRMKKYRGEKKSHEQV